MLPENMDGLTASYHRCMHGEGFVDTFYEIFLNKSPLVAQKFRHTNFAHQKLMLRESLLMMLMYNQELSGVKEELEKLGERHSQRGVDIPPELYDLWLDALCEAVEKHDSDFTKEIGDLWRSGMRAGIDLLISMYE